MKTTAVLSLLVTATSAFASEIPVLKTYDGKHLQRIALPVGGIGTGTISLGGRGEITDWQITNVPALGYTPGLYGTDKPGFLLWFRTVDGTNAVRALEGPIGDGERLHGNGLLPMHRAFERFAEAEFAAAYPYGEVRLSEKGLPVRAKVRAFNPFVPGDSEASSLPVAEFTYEIENLTDQPVEASVCGHLRNFIGCDPSQVKGLTWSGDVDQYRGTRTNRNEYVEGNGLKGVRMYTLNPTNNPAIGTFAFTTAADGGKVTCRTGFTNAPWYMHAVEINDDFAANGELNLPVAVQGAREHDPMAAVAVKKTIPARGRAEFRFYFTWSFPNRRSWKGDALVGNHYTTLYPEAWDAAKRIVPRLPDLERRTRAFVEGFLAKKMPDEIKEAALFNLAVLRSPTVFRIKSGHLMGWEGVHLIQGSCDGSCTHVWNYEQATAYLFPDLARTMRDVEFNYATDEDGRMAFRVALPLEDALKNPDRAADGQMGCILKAYREFKLGGGHAFLASVWPKVKKALSYAWEGSKKYPKESPWDPDADGVMEGPQGNTMDCEYFGPNPQMGFWYLGALKAGAAMAKEMGDTAFAATCEKMFASGKEKLDKICFNGEYYEHVIPAEHRDAPFQLGVGCLVDQLVGQTVARQLGLGDLGDPDHLRKAIASVAKYNYAPDLGKKFNPLRVYGGPGEGGLQMASWPHGFHRNPFPYYSEVMTGFEYVAAAEMVYQGMDELALRTVRDIRARHDGAKRNPFSEAECGHFYARSMASWAVCLAWEKMH